MCVQILPSPDNFKRVIKYHTLQTPLYSGFESVANIAFSFETNCGQRPFKIIRLEQYLKAINAFCVSLISNGNECLFRS